MQGLKIVVDCPHSSASYWATNGPPPIGRWSKCSNDVIWSSSGAVQARCGWCLKKLEDDDDDDDDESIGYVRPLLQLKTVTSVLMIRSDEEFGFQIMTERGWKNLSRSDCTVNRHIFFTARQHSLLC